MNIVLPTPASAAAGLAAPGAPGAMRVPHDPQNRNPCGTKVPHEGQGAPAPCGVAGCGGCAAPDLVLSSGPKLGGLASLMVSRALSGVFKPAGVGKRWRPAGLGSSVAAAADANSAPSSMRPSEGAGAGAGLGMGAGAGGGLTETGACWAVCGGG